MIRYVKHHNVDYIIIDKTIQIDGVLMPTQIQVNIDKIPAPDRSKIFRILSVAFDRNISFDKSPKTQPNKPWWKVW